jgi:hypothetical protein
LYLRLLLLHYTNEEITTVLLRNVNYKKSLNKNNTITTASELAKTKLPNNFPSPPTQVQQQIPATTNKQNPPTLLRQTLLQVFSKLTKQKQ